MIRLSPLTIKQWRRFRSITRGYWSAIGLVVLVAMGWAGSLVLARMRSPEGEEVAIDAELVD